MRLVDLRGEVERVSEALLRARGAAALGTAKAIDLAPVFRGAQEAISWESWSLVKESAEKAEGKRATRLRALQHHLLRLLEAAATASTESDLFRATTALLPAASPGEELAVRVALAEVGEVDNREQRAALERRATSAIFDASSLLARRFEHQQAVAQKAGFASALNAHASLAGVDVAALVTQAQAFLSDTEAMYEDVLSWWLRRTTGLSLFPHGAERHDLLHAMALRPYEGAFPARSALVALSGQLQRMSLSPSADGRIRVDTEARPTKDPENVVLPVVPPREVWISIRPQRGVTSSRAFFFGLGAAQHWAGVEEERPYEDRLMGDWAVPFAIGELFSWWITDRRWLKKHLDVEAADLTRLTGLVLLARARRLAAKWLHSVQVDREGITAGAPKLYAERMGQAMKVAWPAELWLSDADVTMGDGVALRALGLGAMLRELVVEQFDEDWWANPRTGAFLKKIFEQGQFESAAALHERLAGSPLGLMRVAGAFEKGLM